jgi:hypothetical protein
MMMGPGDWVGQTAKGRELLKELEVLSFAEQRTVWEHITRSFAQQSSGIVTFLVEPSSDRGFFGSSLTTCMFPECLSNPKVTALCIVTPTDTR